MFLLEYFEKDIDDLLSDFKSKYELVEYTKIESDQFVKVPEEGFYLHSTQGMNAITDIRVFLKPFEDYYAVNSSSLGELNNLNSLEKLRLKFGDPIKIMKAIQVPWMDLVHPCEKYRFGKYILSAYHEIDSSEIIYFHISFG